MVHPKMKKISCLMHSNPQRNECVWEQKDKFEEPVPKPLDPEEAEKAMGYRGHEVGVTAFSAEQAVRKRINDHNFENDGCIVSFKGCAEDTEHPVEPVPAKRRLELLGNSECVTLLEALCWREQELFPPFEENDNLAS